MPLASTPLAPKWRRVKRKRAWVDAVAGASSAKGICLPFPAGSCDAPRRTSSPLQALCAVRQLPLPDRVPRVSRRRCWPRGRSWRSLAAGGARMCRQVRASEGTRATTQRAEKQRRMRSRSRSAPGHPPQQKSRGGTHACRSLVVERRRQPGISAKEPALAEEGQEVVRDELVAVKGPGEEEEEGERAQVEDHPEASDDWAGEKGRRW